MTKQQASSLPEVRQNLKILARMLDELLKVVFIVMFKGLHDLVARAEHRKHAKNKWHLPVNDFLWF